MLAKELETCSHDIMFAGNKNERRILNFISVTFNSKGRGIRRTRELDK